MFQECRHIMPSGLRCHSPALRDESFCYYHSSLHRSTAPKGKFDDQSLQLPTLEDSSAVQIALTQVLSALGSSQLDSRRAGLLLYAFRSQLRLPRVLPFSSRPTPCDPYVMRATAMSLHPRTPSVNLPPTAPIVSSETPVLTHCGPSMSGTKMTKTKTRTNNL